MTTQEKQTPAPLERLRHHVSGAISRGEAVPVVEVSAPTKHSCGPWEFDGRKIVSPDRYVCTVDDWSAPSVAEQYGEINRALHDEAQANARLIAAAPDLLEALSRLAVWSDRLGPCFCGACDYMPGRPERHKHTAECDNARAAIAKAEGRAGE